MQIKLRVRTNDVKPSPVNHDGFIHFDNCTEVKVNTVRSFDLSEPMQRAEYRGLTKRGSNGMPVRPIREETGKQFDAMHLYVRDFFLTQERLQRSAAVGKEEKNPYHLNVIEWQDRTTEKWHRLVYDTMVFIQNDKGDTLQKVEG